MIERGYLCVSPGLIFSIRSFLLASITLLMLRCLSFQLGSIQPQQINFHKDWSLVSGSNSASSASLCSPIATFCANQAASSLFLMYELMFSASKLYFILLT